MAELICNNLWSTESLYAIQYPTSSVILQLFTLNTGYFDSMATVTPFHVSVTVTL